MAAMMKQLLPAKPKKRNICVAHSGRDMVLLSDSKSANMRGTMTRMTEVSEKDRPQRRKYMGVCRLCLSLMATIMDTFAARMVRRETKTNTKSRPCSSGKLENPHRRNVLTEEWLPIPRVHAATLFQSRRAS